MPRYRAQMGGTFGSGLYPDGPKIDIAGAIDALTSGGSSLIRASMLRRQAQVQQAQDQRREARDIDRDKRESARHDAELEFRRRELDLKEADARRQAVQSGITPAYDELGLSPGTAQITPVTPVAPSAVQRAMAPDGLPGVQMTPSAPAAPQPYTARVFTPEVTQVPEQYDPTRSAKYLQQQAGIEARGTIQRELLEKRLAAAQSGRAFMATAAKELATHRSTLKAREGATQKAMTGNARQEMLLKTAAGLLAQHDGNLQDAVDNLDGSPEGQALVSQGLTSQHLLAAYGAYDRATRQQAMQLQTGAAGLEPADAVSAVRETQALLGSGRKPRTQPTAKPDTGNIRLAPAPSAAPAKPAPAATPARAPAPAPTITTEALRPGVVDFTGGGGARPPRKTVDDAARETVALMQSGQGTIEEARAAFADRPDVLQKIEDVLQKIEAANRTKASPRGGSR